MNSTLKNTIYAPATPLGRSSVAVVRVSGPDSHEGLAALGGALPARGHNKFIVSPLKNPVSRETIDRALVLVFHAPRSYTGEDVVEYHVHGGRAVIDSLLAALAGLPGHRLAEPGEFTRRAFENGRLDLTEAEAVADLINAETAAQKAQALAQMAGALSRLYEGWTERLKKALAHLEADIEFPDEDLPAGIAPQIRPALESLLAQIDSHLADNRRGERLRGGLHVAVIGAPNAGKSSLVNALAQRDVAIVSDIAGTTRDVIEIHLDLGGYPFIVADTAGLNPLSLSLINFPSLKGGGKGEGVEEGHDPIESEGIRRALTRAGEADIRLLLFDSTAAGPDPHTLALINDNALIAVNKIDASSSLRGGRQANAAIQNWIASLPPAARNDALFISAATGEGLDALTEALLEKAKALLGTSETPAITRARHREALGEARESLSRALSASLPELAAEDLRLAVRALGRITGRVDVEDLLDVIFRDFCIGK